MGLFEKFKDGLRKTHTNLVHEIKRIVTLSPRLSGATLDELEAALLGADLGIPVTEAIVAEVRKSYETQGRDRTEVFEIARGEVEKALSSAAAPLRKLATGVTVVSIVGVNGTGKTTTAAKLAHWVQSRGDLAVLAACDTFRAAAIEQLKLWGQRVDVPVIAGAYGADPAAVAHDAVVAAQARKAAYLFVDTAGRLHTKHNLMQELQKLHRVMDKKVAGAPHETLLVLVTKLDGTSKGGMIVAIQKELGIPIKFVGLGEQADDLQPFNPAEYARALFDEKE